MSTRRSLINTRCSRFGDIINEIVDSVVSACYNDGFGGFASDISSFDSSGRRSVETNGGENEAEFLVDGGVETGAMESPEESVMGCVGDGELLKGEGFVGAFYGREVDCALDYSFVPP